MTSKKVNREMQEIGLIGEELNVNPTNSGLFVFPGELWDLIIEKLTNSQDILNVLRAFPDLDNLFSNKKFGWMFDMILPHIMTKYLLTKEEHGQEDYEFLFSDHLFKLRLISKRWKNAVEFSLENHVDRHPPLPQNQNTANNKSIAYIPENHFNYNRMQKFHMGATIFHQAKHIDQFLSEMGNYEGNPFPGRFVFISGIILERRATDGIYAKKSVELLQKFGQHIFVLDWEVANEDDDECNLEMCKRILKGLSYVPNLKSLKIRSDYEIDLWESVNDFFKNPETQRLFPELPFLEIFNWRIQTSGEENSWISRMFNTYGKQKGIIKLSIDVIHFSSDFVSNTLTELNLLVEHMDFQDVMEIKENLVLIPKGQIRKLVLSDIPSRKTTRQRLLH